jgi:predicted PurR-regulated permease PerM
MNKTSLRSEQVIGFVVLALLLLGCLMVIRPFVSALLWAIVLCFSIWPAYRRLLRWVRNRRTLAALLMTLAMIVIILVPFVLIGMTLADSVGELTAATRTWLDEGLGAPPVWLAKIPLLGSKAVEFWENVAQDSAKVLPTLRRFVEPVSSWLLRAGLGLGSGLLELALSILAAFFLFRDGATAAEHLGNAVDRIAGDRGRYLLKVAGDTIRGVVYGILGTALAQAVVAGIGFLIAGVPGAALLALLTFFLSVVPVGPPLVWIPTAIWLFKVKSVGWGIFMLIWGGAAVSGIDNVVKPWLISQGSKMPFILILFGVLGGALAFGFIGVFLGPTLLAVGFRLVQEWASARRAVADAHGATGEPAGSP